jgi:hypothetical protein
MLPQIATAVRTDCGHLEAGPSSVDAQSKDRKGSAVLSPALGARCWRDRPETAGVSWLWPWPRLGQFCLRGGLVAFPDTRTLDLSALVTLVFVDRDTSSHLAGVRPTIMVSEMRRSGGKQFGFNSLALRETSFSSIGHWHPWAPDYRSTVEPRMQGDPLGETTRTRCPSVAPNSRMVVTASRTPNGYSLPTTIV